jgi:Ion channel
MPSVGTNPYSDLIDSPVITSGVDGSETILKSISLDELELMIHEESFLGSLIGYEILIGEKKELLIDSSLNFIHCRFKNASKNGNDLMLSCPHENDKTVKIYFRECIFGINPLFIGGKNTSIELDVFSAHEFFKFSLVGEFFSVTLKALKKYKIRFQLRAKVETLFVSGVDLRISMIGAGIKKFTVRNSIISDVNSSNFDSIELFNVDNVTLKESCKIRSPLVLRGGPDEDRFTVKGWRILEDAIPSFKKQQTEYLSYLSGLNRYRVKEWKLNLQVRKKLILFLRYVLFVNFSSFYRVVFLNVLLIIVYALIYQMINHFFGSPRLVGTNDFFGYLYFSSITYTTTGYGDIKPDGFFRIIAAIESFHGILMVIFTGFVFQKWITNQTVELD